MPTSRCHHKSNIPDTQKSRSDKISHGSRATAPNRGGRLEVVPWVLCENDCAVRARWQSTWFTVKSMAERADKAPLRSSRFTHSEAKPCCMQESSPIER
jgi:hypothetical protein